MEGKKPPKARAERWPSLILRIEEVKKEFGRNKKGLRLLLEERDSQNRITRLAHIPTDSRNALPYRGSSVPSLENKNGSQHEVYSLNGVSTLKRHDFGCF
jgi:hypothetical protein